MIIRSKYPMSIGNAFESPRSILPTPQPGEIWQLRRTIQSPLETASLERYSPIAQQYLQGSFSDHFVMIVRSIEPEIPSEDAWQAFTVMVLSEAVDCVSDVNVLIPAHISGVGQDLLAQTWQILPMLGCNLQQSIGIRLSRSIYDALISVGDAYHGLVTEALPSVEIQALGLAIAPPGTHQQAHIQAFHQQEIAWSDVLSMPFADYQAYVQSLRWADRVLASALEVEQMLQTLSVISIPTHPRVNLANWFQHQFDSGWCAIEDLTQSGILHLTLSPSRQAETLNRIRTCSEDAAETEIAALIRQLAADTTEVERRRTIKQLGEIAQGNSRAIQALIQLLRSTEDDETRWTIVESLWQIDPGNPAAGVRRVRLLDLGMQVSRQTIALAVAMIQKSDRQVGIMLRLYPTGDEPYLPEHLKLTLLDDVGQAYEVLARRNDLYVQLKFTGCLAEEFSVQVSLGEVSITEDFVI